MLSFSKSLNKRKTDRSCKAEYSPVYWGDVIVLPKQGVSTIYSGTTMTSPMSVHPRTRRNAFRIVLWISSSSEGNKRASAAGEPPKPDTSPGNGGTIGTGGWRNDNKPLPREGCRRLSKSTHGVSTHGGEAMP